MELNEIIANNIYNLRNDRGMTQTELAEKLNYTDKLVSKWERGEAIPNAYALKQISEIFSVSMDYIFSSHEDEAVPKESSVSRRVITAISIMGITISLAGKPNTKAVRITPSIPISFPKGSIASVQCMSRVLSPAVTFAKIHITIPAGAATLTALPSTNKVRSNTERVIVLPICGLR